MCPASLGKGCIAAALRYQPGHAHAGACAKRHAHALSVGVPFWNVTRSSADRTVDAERHGFEIIDEFNGGDGEFPLQCPASITHGKLVSLCLVPRRARHRETGAQRRLPNTKRPGGIQKIAAVHRKSLGTRDWDTGVHNVPQCSPLRHSDACSKRLGATNVGADKICHHLRPPSCRILAVK